MGVIRQLPLLLVLLVGAAQAKEPAAFKRAVAGAEVDWSAGTITAQAGSAADSRMPGPNAARPGAERRARAAAEEKLRAALRTLGLGKTADDQAAIKNAATSRIEYQSDGGVVLWLGLRFPDIVPAKQASTALKVATTPFEIAPTIAAGEKEVRVARATYQPMSSAPKDAVSVRCDEKGRLVLPAGRANVVESLAGTAVVIYLEAAQP
jgi:hypothetical protein